MRLLAFIFLFLMMMFAMSSPLASRLASSGEPIRIVTESYPPFQMLDDHQELKGVAFEKVRAALEQIKLDVDIEVLPWARAYKLSQQRPNTLIFSVSRNVQREDKFIWIAKLASVDTYIYKLSSNHHFNIASLNDAGNWIAGIERDDVTANILKTSIPEGRIITATDTADLVRMLYSGRIDIMPGNPYELAHYCQKLNCKVDDFTALFELKGLSPDVYFAAHPKTDKSLVAELKAAFAAQKSTL